MTFSGRYCVRIFSGVLESPRQLTKFKITTTVCSKNDDYINTLDIFGPSWCLPRWDLCPFLVWTLYALLLTSFIKITYQYSGLTQCLLEQHPQQMWTPYLILFESYYSWTNILHYWSFIYMNNCEYSFSMVNPHGWTLGVCRSQSFGVRDAWYDRCLNSFTRISGLSNADTCMVSTYRWTHLLEISTWHCHSRNPIIWMLPLCNRASPYQIWRHPQTIPEWCVLRVTFALGCTI